MKKTNLEELLFSFTKEEKRKFTEFLNSPLFNKSRQILKLHNILKRHVPIKKIHKLEVFKKIYGNEKYNDQKIRSLYSDLLRLLREFLVIQNISKYINPQTVLLNEFNDRQVYKNFDQLSNSMIKSNTTQFAPDSMDYLSLIQLYDNLTFKSDIMLSSKKEKYTKIKKLYAKMYFAFSLLRDLNNELQLNIPFEGQFEKDLDIVIWITNFIQSNIDLIKNQHKMLYVEYLTYSMFLPHGNKVFYETLIKEFKKNHSCFKIESQTYIYNSLSSYAINMKYNDPFFDWKFEIIRVPRLFEKTGYFKKLKWIEGPNFYNIIDSYIENNKVEYAEFFLNKYGKRIIENVRYDVLNLSISRILICKKNYAEALDHISLITNKHPHIYLNSKLFQSVIFFESNDYLTLTYLIDATIHYLHRNRSVIGLRYHTYLNFFKYLNKIINKIDTVEKSYYKILGEKILEDKMVRKEWLLEVISRIVTKTN